VQGQVHSLRPPGASRALHPPRLGARYQRGYSLEYLRLLLLMCSHIGARYQRGYSLEYLRLLLLMCSHIGARYQRGYSLEYLRLLLLMCSHIGARYQRGYSLLGLAVMCCTPCRCSPLQATIFLFYFFIVSWGWQLCVVHLVDGDNCRQLFFLFF